MEIFERDKIYHVREREREREVQNPHTHTQKTLNVVPKEKGKVEI